MAADGEVEIQVRAEGADEAASELSEGSEAGMGGGGGGAGMGDSGGVGKSLKDIVKLLGVITAVTKALDPLLKFVEALFEINAAFWAPVAMMLLRWLTPVLRFWLKILPKWYAFIDESQKLLGQAVSFIKDLPNRIGRFIDRAASWLREKLNDAAEYLRTLPRRIWEFIRDIPRMIAEKIQGVLPGGGDIGGAVSGTAGDIGSGVNQYIEDKTNINLSGGLETFVDRVEKESGLDIP